MLVTALLAVAAAHPFGGAMPGHDIALDLGPEGVRLRYDAALPTHDLLVELKAAGADSPEAALAFTEARLDELAAGLGGRRDGEALRWTRTSPASGTGRGDQRLVRFSQTLEAEGQGAPGVLAISNGNLPDQLSYYRWRVRVHPSLEVLACSLLDVEDGRVVETRDGQWRMDEPQRELLLRLRPRALPWMARLLGEGDAPRSPQEALARGPLDALRAGVLTRELGLATLVTLALAGALRGGALRRVADALALGCALATAALAPALGATAALAWAAAALASRRLPGRGRLGGLVALVLLLGLGLGLGWMHHVARGAPSG